jgi:hypothetical protein
MAIMDDPSNPLKCYCGKPTKIYDSLFRRNFCSDECSTALRVYLGGTDATVKIMGEFRISGSVVTLHETLAKHQQSKIKSIDAIDAQVQKQIEKDKQRADLKKIGLADNVIEAMLKVT